MNIKAFTFNPFQENTYVVSNNAGDALVIDPGCSNPQEEARLHNYLIEEGLRLQCIVNTHLHIDHVLGNRFLEETFGVRSMAHQSDAFWLERLPEQAKMFGIPLLRDVPQVGIPLVEGDRIWLGKEGSPEAECFDVFEVPGHAPGHIVLYNANNACLFAGDVLFKGSIGRTDLIGGNYEQLIDGIRSKLLVLPEDTDVFCGHGPVTSIGKEKQHNPFIP